MPTMLSFVKMQRPTVEVTGHKAHGAVPEPGSVVIARVLTYGSNQ